MIGLPHDTDIEIPYSKEATETNNQAELATTTIMKVNTNQQRQEQILFYTVQILMFQLQVQAEKMIIKNQLRYPQKRVDIRLRTTSFLLLAPSSFVIMSLLYLLTQTDKIVYLEIQSIFWTTFTIWMIL